MNDDDDTFHNIDDSNYWLLNYIRIEIQQRNKQMNFINLNNVLNIWTFRKFWFMKIHSFLLLLMHMFAKR